MGRTNVVILGLGIGACVILSMLMQHAVKATRERNEAPLVTELHGQFGNRFAAPPTFEITRHGSSRIGTLVLFPHMSSRPRRLAQSIGDYCWRNPHTGWEFDALLVICDDGFGRATRFDVPSPRDLTARLRQLGPDELPVVRPLPRAAAPSPAPQPTSKPATQPSRSAPAK